MPTMEYYHMILREIGPSVKDFERRVYTQGLSRIIDAEPTRGMGGQLAGLTVLTYVIAGRVMVTLTGDGYHVSMAAAEKEDPPRMGLHTTNAEPQRARDMIHAAIEAWPQDESAQDRVLTADPNITIG